MLPAVCASKALRPSASLVEDLEISFVVETTQKMVAITRLEVAEQHAGFPLVRPLRDVLSRPCKIHPTAQANLFTAFFLAPFAAASAVASIQSCANKGVKKPFRPRRTMALSSQQML